MRVHNKTLKTNFNLLIAFRKVIITTNIFSNYIIILPIKEENLQHKCHLCGQANQIHQLFHKYLHYIRTSAIIYKIIFITHAHKVLTN